MRHNISISANEYAASRELMVLQVEASKGTPEELVFRAVEDGITLSVTVAVGPDGLIVRRASHSGGRTAEERQVFDCLCANIKDRPLQEAAEHGAIYTLEQLLPLANLPQGIRLPRNAGRPFALAERLIRTIDLALREQLKKQCGENYWYPRPSAMWLKMSAVQQIDFLKPLVNEFLLGVGLNVDAAQVSRIEKRIRITIAFRSDVSSAAKPQLLMALERKLRDATESPLELFMEEKVDANQIRRL